MKDKRQRLALTWPCDPAVYAYLVNAAHAATSYPYIAPSAPATHPVLPPPAPAPFGYYSAGLQRVAAAAAVAAASTPSSYPSLDAAAYSLRPGATIDYQLRAPVAPLPSASSSPSEPQLSLPGHVMPPTTTSMTSSSKSTPLFQPFKADVQRA